MLFMLIISEDLRCTWRALWRARRDRDCAINPCEGRRCCSVDEGHGAAVFCVVRVLICVCASRVVGVGAHFVLECVALDAACVRAERVSASEASYHVSMFSQNAPERSFRQSLPRFRGSTATAGRTGVRSAHLCSRATTRASRIRAPIGTASAMLCRYEFLLRSVVRICSVPRDGHS